MYYYGVYINIKMFINKYIFRNLRDNFSPFCLPYNEIDVLAKMY